MVAARDVIAWDQPAKKYQILLVFSFLVLCVPAVKIESQK
jgi:hypothetical protein